LQVYLVGSPQEVEVAHVVGSKITLEGSKHRADRYIQGLDLFSIDIEKELRSLGTIGSKDTD
jgi:hypothetical protein